MFRKRPKLPSLLQLTGAAAVLAWYFISPAGYLAYSWKYITHLRWPEIWLTEQKEVSNTAVLPELQKWKDDLGRASEQPELHKTGETLLAPDWMELQRYYRGFGIEITDRVSYFSRTPGDDTQQFISMWGQKYPRKLQELHARLARNLAALKPELLRHHPQLVSVYLISRQPDCFIFWPGGNHYALYTAGFSPCIATGSTKETNDWRDAALKEPTTFEPTSGDSLGLGNTMITGVSFNFEGTRVFVAADVRWEDSSLGPIRLIVIFYDLWFILGIGGIALGSALQLGKSIRRGRPSDAVCITVSIDKQDSGGGLEERYIDQELIVRMADKAFKQSARQTTLLAWPSVGGYHLLFASGWGSEIYSDSIEFVICLLKIWGRSPLDEAETATLRIAIGRHGPFIPYWVNGRLSPPWVRISSSAKIAELSRKHQAQEGGLVYRVVCEETYFDEAAKYLGTRLFEKMEPVGGTIDAQDGSGTKYTFRSLKKTGAKSRTPMEASNTQLISSQGLAKNDRVAPAVFDVFVSYNSQDEVVVQALALELKACGLTVWLDKLEIKPGSEWIRKVETIIKTCRSSVICIGKGGLGPWQEPEVDALLFRYMREKRSGKAAPVIPVLLPGAPADHELPVFLQLLQCVDLRRGLESAWLDEVVRVVRSTISASNTGETEQSEA